MTDEDIDLSDIPEVTRKCSLALSGVETRAHTSEEAANAQDRWRCC